MIYLEIEAWVNLLLNDSTNKNG